MDWHLMLPCTMQEDFVSASQAPAAKLTRVARRADSASADAGGAAGQQQGAAACTPATSSDDNGRPAAGVDEPGVACARTALCKNQCLRAIKLCAVHVLPSLLRAVARLHAPGNKGTSADMEAGGVHGILGIVSERSVSSSAPVHAPPLCQPGGSCSFPPAAHRRLSKARSKRLLVKAQPASSAVYPAATAAGLISVVTHSSRLAAAHGSSRLLMRQRRTQRALLWQTRRPA